MTRPAVLEIDPQAWRDEALAYVESRARAGHSVTADDVRRDLPEPPHPNAVGGVFLALSRRNVIEKLGHRSSACQTRRHGVLAVWGLHPDQRPRHSKAGAHLARLVGRAD